MGRYWNERDLTGFPVTNILDTSYDHGYTNIVSKTYMGPQKRSHGPHFSVLVTEFCVVARVDRVSTRHQQKPPVS